MKTKTTSVEEFLKAKTKDRGWLGGTRCATCGHAQAEAINRELRVFAKAKQDGHAMPWKRFFRDRLGPVYGLKVVPTALMRHVRDCLELS